MCQSWIANKQNGLVMVGGGGGGGGGVCGWWCVCVCVCVCAAAEGVTSKGGDTHACRAPLVVGVGTVP
jgi:hypothetical protein